MSTQTLTFDESGLESSTKKALKVRFTSQTHWDMEWYRLRADYQIRLGEVMDDVVHRLSNGELGVFCLDGQTNALLDYLDLLRYEESSLNEAISKAASRKIEQTLALVKSGKLNIGPWFIQPDFFLVSGESLIRNLQKGIEYANRLGVNDFIGYLPDQFGQPSDMPILLNGFGIDIAMMNRGANPKNAEFFWVGRDGSKVLTYWLAKGYWFTAFHDFHLSDVQKADATRQFIDTIFARTHSGNVFMPLGFDHRGATPTEGLQQLKALCPDAEEVTYFEFMKELKEDIGAGEDLEVHRGHLLDNTHFNILQGVYSARLYLKQSNRKLEHELSRNVEPLMAFSQTMLSQPPHLRVRELEKAWTELLLNQPHDSICGTSIDEVHLENEARFNNSAIVAADIRLKETAAINQEMAGPGQWIIFNNSAKPYTGVVKIKEWAYPNVRFSEVLSEEVQSKLPKTALPQITHVEYPMEDFYLLDIYNNPDQHICMMKREGLAWVENVPAYGVKVVDQAPAQPPVPVQADRKGLNNGLLSLTVDPEGTLTVTDLKTGTTYPGLHQIIDQADAGDSYNAAPVPGSPRQNAQLQETKLIEQGPLRATLELTFRIPGNEMTVITRVSLEAGNPQVLFETDYTNNSPAHKMQAVFPTGAPVSEVRAESHFGIEARAHDPEYNELNLMPAKYGVCRELPTNTGAIQRFVIANGHLLLTEGLAEYEVLGNELNITLLRAFGKLSDMTCGVRDDEAGPPWDTPGGQMIGRAMSVRYAWQPAPAADSEAYDAADRFYGIVFGEQGRAKQPVAPSETSMLQCDNPAAVVQCVKWAEKSEGLLVRMINTTDQPQTASFKLGFDVKRILQVDFAERVKAELDAPTLTIAPYAVETLVFIPARGR